MLDRIEEEKGVLLIQEVEKEWIIDKSKLPEGIKTGDWVTIEIINGQISNLVIDPALTKEKQQTADQLLESLRQRHKGSRFKRK